MSKLDMRQRSKHPVWLAIVASYRLISKERTVFNQKQIGQISQNSLIIMLILIVILTADLFLSKQQYFAAYHYYSMQERGGWGGGFQKILLCGQWCDDTLFSTWALSWHGSLKLQGLINSGVFGRMPVCVGDGGHLKKEYDRSILACLVVCL